MEYLKWLINHKKHRFKILLFVIGLVGCIFLIPTILTADAPVVAKIFGIIPLVGFTFGIAYEPYTIFKRLKRMGKL